MAQKKNYNRYFIIFQEEDKGYGIAIDKQPTGYTKIETRSGKCKITVYVQNLLVEKGPYTCCLIDATKNPLVVAKLGEVSLDSSGRGETWWEYNEDNIAETGLSPDRFSLATILANSEEVKSPLAGYIGKDRSSWKERMQINTKGITSKKEEAIKEEVKIDVTESNIPQDNIDVKIDINDMRVDENIAEEIPEVENLVEDIDDEAQKFRDYEIEIKNQMDEISKWNEINDICENNKDRFNDMDIIDEYINDENINYKEFQRDNLENNYDMPRHDHKDEKKSSYEYIFHDILKDFGEVEKVDMKKSRWWKIPVAKDLIMKNKEHYPCYCAIHHLKMTYPYINYIKYFKPYGYYYFGIKYDEKNKIKYMMYGIPGGNTRKEQPYNGMTGFMKWIKIDEDKGMWVMYYNPYTGSIMIPKESYQSMNGR